MTFSPQSLKDLGAYWVANKGVNLGIVGDAPHAAVGVSYHLGKSQLTANAYSRQLPRDVAGLTEAASAIDLGRLNGSLKDLQGFSRWLVARCMADAKARFDVREIIYSPNGIDVQRYSGVSNRIVTGAGNGDASHRFHTHISFFRDSEKRDKRANFRAFFELPDSSTEEPDVAGPDLTDVALEPGWITVKAIPGVQAIQANDLSLRDELLPGTRKRTIGKARVKGDPFGPDDAISRHIVRLLAGKDENGVEQDLAVILADQVVFAPDPVPVPNCDVAVTAALDHLTAPLSALVTAVQEARP